MTKPDPELELGWVDHELAEELPGLALFALREQFKRQLGSGLGAG